jgi:putative MATE family efflux protein
MESFWAYHDAMPGDAAAPLATPRERYTRLIGLALPIMAGSFAHTLYNVVDTWFLGKLGKEAVAAPTIAFNIVMLLTVLGSSFGSAAMTLIAQSRGAGDDAKANRVLGQAATIMLGSGILLMAVGFACTEPLLYLLQVPPDVYAPTLEYMRICMAEIPLMFVAFLFSGAAQASGDAVTPLKLQLIAVALNVALDPLLIFGFGPVPAMGVAGAAVATVASRAVSAAASMRLLCKGTNGLKLSLSRMRLDRDTAVRLAKIGLPSSLGQALSTLGFTVMQGAVNAFGAAVIAAFGVGNKIIGLFNMPAMGFSQATAALVGRSLGAGDVEGAKLTVRQSLLTIFAFIGVAMTFTFFFGAELTRFFVDDAEVIAHGVTQFRIVSISVVFFALFNVLTGAFQGGGDTVPIMATNIVRLWVLRVPSLYALAFAFGMGPDGIWWSMVISNLGVTAIAYAVYRGGRWARRIYDAPRTIASDMETVSEG